MQFKINLATRIYINTRQLKYYTALALVLLLVILLFTIGNIAGRVGDIKHYSHQVGILDQQSKPATQGVSEKEYNSLLPRIAFANSVIDKKRYNWLALLDKLEQVVPEGVAISSVEPDSKTNGLKLPGIARNFDRLRAFMEKLEDSKVFTDVYLMTQAETTFEDKTKGITFTLTCKVMDK